MFNKLFRGVLPVTGLLALTATPGAAAQTSDLSAAVRPLPASVLLLHELGPLSASTSVAVAQPAAEVAAASSSFGDAADLVLPDAPLPQGRSEDLPRPQFGDPKPAPGSTPAHEIAPKYAKFVPAGWTSQRLTAHEKVVMGAEDLYSFSNFAAMFLSAGYSHVVNSEPNYGSNKTAFGQRLGAAAVRETSQGIFTDMVFGNVLHEDTRYYAEGPSFSPVHRTLYAITRPFITRTDSGGKTVNGALLLGYAASAALTPAFYPQVNRNFRDTASTYGTSIGGAALGFFIDEISNDVFYKLHLRRTP